MTAAPLLDDDPGFGGLCRAALSPYAVEIRSCRPELDTRVVASELTAALAARLGVCIGFDEHGYDAEFTIVAEDESDAIATAHRRWFYLASDLELPMWPVVDVVVRPLSRTHAATW